jgi:hypothetical protein
MTENDLEQDEELVDFKDGLAELGWTPRRLAKRLVSLGDSRSSATIIRSINRAFEGDTRVSGELGSFVRLQVRHLRLLHQLYGTIQWTQFDTGEKAKYGDYTLIVDQRKQKWAVSVTHRHGRSEPWPNHLETIELAKDMALIMLDDCIDFVGKAEKRRAAKV